jgi:tetraacyldisaccharide 4'-kinase
MSDTGGKLEQFINKVWYGKSWFFIPLLPLTVVFALVAALRRLLYRRGILASSKISVPVIVVGNIAVGGAGKTPVTLWLANLFKSKGMNPAIISRGYGGKAASQPVHVTADSDAAEVGDEPVLLARRSGCPVYVDADRVRGAKSAVSNGADVILSDDGLQHYRMQRDIEIAVVDGSRGFGNGFLLPAGPLREPVSRLDKADRILIQVAKDGSGLQVDTSKFADKMSCFSLAGELLRRVSDARTREISDLKGKSVHAVAGIANPDRFFEQLECYGIQVHRHPKPDHARLSEADVSFDDDLDVIVTEKDAVKCKSFAHERLWYLPVSVSFENSEDLQWFDALHDKLRSSRTQDSL